MNLRTISIYKYVIIFITFLIIIIFSSPDNKFRMLDNMIETMKDNEGKIYMISKIHHSHYTSAYKIFLDKNNIRNWSKSI